MGGDGACSSRVLLFLCCTFPSHMWRTLSCESLREMCLEHRDSIESTPRLVREPEQRRGKGQGRRFKDRVSGCNDTSGWCGCALASPEVGE